MVYGWHLNECLASYGMSSTTRRTFMLALPSAIENARATRALLRLCKDLAKILARRYRWFRNTLEQQSVIIAASSVSHKTVVTTIYRLHQQKSVPRAKQACITFYCLVAHKMKMTILFRLCAQYFFRAISFIAARRIRCVCVADISFVWNAGLHQIRLVRTMKHVCVCVCGINCNIMSEM